jgi:hypothetical protein
MAIIGAQTRRLGEVAALTAVLCSVVLGQSPTAAAQQGSDRRASRGTVIVKPRFGGQILGYDIDRNGTEGLLTESVAEGVDTNLVATEAFDQQTGAIIAVIAKQNHSANDFVTQIINADNFGLVLYQHGGQNEFLTLNPLTSNKFTGKWTPPIKSGYQLWTTSLSQGSSPIVAAYQSSFETGLTYVFASNIAKNTFGPQISLASIEDVDEFFHPLIALDTKTNQAVLADSNGCDEPGCVESIALVNLKTGEISKFTNNLGLGDVNGLAVDPETGIACTTTLSDGGIEFYDLANQSGFEVFIPNGLSPIQAGIDVEFDPIHKVFLISQYDSTGSPENPVPMVYVYDEAGNLKESINIQRIPISPARIVLNPVKRVGFLPLIVEPQNMALQLQSFSY